MFKGDGPNISPSEIVILYTPGEGQSPISFISEPNWEALAILRDYYVGRNDFNEEKEI